MSDGDTPDKSLQMRIVVDADDVGEIASAKARLREVANHLNHALCPLDFRIDIRTVSPENDSECFGDEHEWERIGPKYSDGWTRECQMCGTVDEVVERVE